eukprot:CAMPEP_0113819684 /NCGR_PEP_ID=MMETSP0328-20130328/862_1 /TAXON_ID=39455 /ORGANISM="Alexandrium minutum" /LENGTH=112 /DNA_ID=CAMNT_0000787617 /DNA_START=97 /DNA_END=436 /DNA_ORIENTATION=+ /assembly_acc=CAM_ASM_000350
MAPLLVLLLATACVAIDRDSCQTRAPQESSASPAGADEDEAALLQVSSNRTQRLGDDGCECCYGGDTCCAYCLNDKGHSNKRTCITTTAEKKDARPFCEAAVGRTRQASAVN